MWRAVAAAATAAALLAGCGTGDDGEEAAPVSTYTITQGKETVEAALGEVGRILEDELGADGWRQHDPPQVVHCGEAGSSRYWSGVRSLDVAVAPERWPAVWERILAALESHGFTDTSEDAGGTEGSHFLRIQNGHDDTLTISTTQPNATAYRGDSGCHPGFIELPAGDR